MILLSATVLSANVAVALEVLTVTSSLPTLPTGSAVPVNVAVSVRLYTLFTPDRPDTVRFFFVMAAESVGCVST